MLTTENSDLDTNTSPSLPIDSIPVSTSPEQTMHIRKRNGAFEPVNVDKIVKAVLRSCSGLSHVDPMKVATKTIGGLYDGASTKELDNLSIQTASQLISEEPEYSRLAARLLATTILKEVQNQDIYSFSQAIGLGYER